MSIAGMSFGEVIGVDNSHKHTRGSKHVSLTDFEYWIENIVQGDRKNGDTFGKSFCNKFEVLDPQLCAMEAEEAHELIWNWYIK